MQKEPTILRTAAQQTRVETTSCTCGADMTLPDYLPEIRRVLSTRVRVMPGGTFVDRGKAEFAGNCRFCVLYLDPEGKPASAELTGEYEWSVPTGGAEDAEVFGVCEPGTVSCRLGGPRRLSVTTELLCRAVIFSPAPAAEEESESAARHEKLIKELPGRTARPFVADPLNLSASVRIDAAGEVRILSLDGGVSVREIETRGGEAVAHGEACVNALCAAEDGSVFGVPVRMPFEESVAALPADVPARVICRGDLSGVEGEISQAGDRTLTVTATVILSGIVFEAATTEKVADRFSTEFPTRVTYRTDEVWETQASLHLTVTLDGTHEGPADAGSCSVADTYVTPGPVSWQVEGSKLSADLTLRVSMLLRGAPDADGRAELSGFSFDAPQHIELTLPAAAPEGATASGTVSIVSVKGRCDGERLFYSCEAALSAHVDVRRTVQTAESAADDTEHPYPDESGCITAAYLRDGDSLWSVAKRYHTPPVRIAEQNALSEDALRSPDSAFPLDGYIKLLIEHDKKA